MFGRILFFRKSRVLAREKVAGLAIELVVVFVGVYLAFLASDFQEELEDRAIRVKYYQSMILEFEALSSHLEDEHARIQRHLAVVSEIEQGGQPDLAVGDLSYLYRGSVVAAAFESQNFESLDDEILADIIGGIPLLERLEDRVDRFNALMLPVQASGAPIYDPAGRLLPHLAWYPRLVREIETANRTLYDVVANRAIPDLEADRDRLREQRFPWPF